VPIAVEVCVLCGVEPKEPGFDVCADCIELLDEAGEEARC
jgi:hypothetical protein